MLSLLSIHTTLLFFLLLVLLLILLLLILLLFLLLLFLLLLLSLLPYNHLHIIKAYELSYALSRDRHGGYTAVLTMPNLNPAPDSTEGVEEQLAAIRRGASIAVIPYGTITKGSQGFELSDMETIAPKVAAFSDDGRGVQSEEMMLAAMQKAKSLGKMIVAHCEDNSLLRGGYIHDGEYARAHGHRGICSESEWGPIARDVELLKKSGAAYHVCHVSTKESVEIIRRAKAEGVDITCETAPHYLTLDDSCLQEDGRFKTARARTTGHKVHLAVEVVAYDVEFQRVMLVGGVVVCLTEVGACQGELVEAAERVVA